MRSRAAASAPSNAAMAARARRSRGSNGSAASSARRVNAEERQHTTNLARCRSRFEERRKLARGVQGTLERGNSLGNRPPRSQIFEAGKLTQIPGVAEPTIERADLLAREEPRLLSKQKCGERSSATMESREKLVSTRSRTRSTAAAVGSAASGSASEV